MLVLVVRGSWCRGAWRLGSMDGRWVKIGGGVVVGKMLVFMGVRGEWDGFRVIRWGQQGGHEGGV